MNLLLFCWTCSVKQRVSSIFKELLTHCEPHTKSQPESSCWKTLAENRTILQFRWLTRIWKAASHQSLRSFWPWPNRCFWNLVDLRILSPTTTITTVISSSSIEYNRCRGQVLWWSNLLSSSWASRWVVRQSCHNYYHLPPLTFNLVVLDVNPVEVELSII